jgi:ATP diphosphatase
VNLARVLQVDPEIALKNANAKFARRFRQMERLATENGQAFAQLPREDKERLWEAAKRMESARDGGDRPESEPAKSKAAKRR